MLVVLLWSGCAGVRVGGANERVDLGVCPGRVDQVAEYRVGVFASPVEVDGVVVLRLLQEGEHHGERAEVLLDIVVADGVPHAAAAAHGEDVVDRVVVVQGQADLLEVVDALGPPGGLAGRLHGGQEQGDQDGDDGDDDQQFDQGEATTTHGRILLDM